MKMKLRRMGRGDKVVGTKEMATVVTTKKKLATEKGPKASGEAHIAAQERWQKEVDERSRLAKERQALAEEKQAKINALPLPERIAALKQELDKIASQPGNSAKQKERVMQKMCLAARELAGDDRFSDEQLAIKIMAMSGLKPRDKSQSLWEKHLAKAKLGIKKPCLDINMMFDFKG